MEYSNLLDSPIQIVNDPIIYLANLVHVAETASDDGADGAKNNFGTLFDELARNFPVEKLDMLKQFIRGMDHFLYQILSLPTIRKQYSVIYIYTYI